jgi:hypothetical protein
LKAGLSGFRMYTVFENGTIQILEVIYRPTKEVLKLAKFSGFWKVKEKMTAKMVPIIVQKLIVSSILFLIVLSIPHKQILFQVDKVDKERS